jgi:hypothetical protein
MGMFPGRPLGWIASVMVCCHIGNRPDFRQLFRTVSLFRIYNPSSRFRIGRLFAAHTSLAGRFLRFALCHRSRSVYSVGSKELQPLGD